MTEPLTPHDVKVEVKKELKKSDYSWIRKDWVVVIVLFFLLSVLAFGVTRIQQGIEQTKIINEYNNRFLENFSNYMTCLIVNEDEVILAVGEDAYVEICKQLLFRGIPDIPPTIKATIPDLSTTTTTQGD